jgi:RHS repeat-associated protein
MNTTTQPAYFDYFEIVHKPNAEKLTVTSWAEYYAFGKVAKASCPSSGSYWYGYQGEFAEKDGETDWNSFELRQYDSEIGRWLSVDPYQQYWSPYVGMGNDPSNRVDADGGVDEYAVDSKGNRTWLSDLGRSDGIDFFHYGDWKDGGFIANYTVMMPMSGGWAGMSEGLRMQIADFKRTYVPVSVKIPRPDDNGHLTLGEANNHYRNGDKAPLTVDLSKINLQGINETDFPLKNGTRIGSDGYFNLLYGNSHSLNDGLVFGTIKLVYAGNGKVTAPNNDIYDFEMHSLSWKNFYKEIPRNILTVIGGTYAGSGRSYNIHFRGQGNIKTPSQKTIGLQWHYGFGSIKMQ